MPARPRTITPVRTASLRCGMRCSTTSTGGLAAILTRSSKARRATCSAPGSRTATRLVRSTGTTSRERWRHRWVRIARCENRRVARCFSSSSWMSPKGGDMQVVEANGARIPLLGLGTWDLRGRVCARIVEQALRLGYRHIDTAQMYDNEREVGEGLRASGVPRDQVFITTKIWPTHFAPPDLERSAKESVARLRMTNVDLLLLH